MIYVKKIYIDENKKKIDLFILSIFRHSAQCPAGRKHF
jgi:hypothetical protein